MWLGNEPLPAPATCDLGYQPAAYDEANLERMVDGCRSPALRASLRALAGDVRALGAELLFQTTYFPTRFTERLAVYQRDYPRRPMLSLPLLAEDYAGAHIPE